MTITNKYAGRCSSCSCSVASGAGTATKTSSGWQVSCHLHASAQPATAPRSNTVRRNRRPLGVGHGSAASVRGYSSYCTARPDCRCYDCAS